MNQALLDKCRGQKIRIIVIGASAGGVEAYKRIIPGLRKPSGLSVALVLHIPAQGPNLMPELLQDVAEFKVVEAISHLPMEPETVFVAPPDYHLNVEQNGTLTLSTEELVNYSRPSIDILFESAAHAFGQKCLAVLLTGSNDDGARGLVTVSQQGGICVTQKISDAEFNYMPRSGLELVPSAHQLTLDEVAELFTALTGSHL